MELGRFHTSLMSMSCASYLVFYVHSNLKNLNQQVDHAHMVFCLWSSQRLANSFFFFFCWFTKIVECKGFAYGDWKTKLPEKLIRLWFNMEDQWVKALETQDAITKNKCDLQRLTGDILLFEKRYPCILTSYFCTTFVFILTIAKKLSRIHLFGDFFFIDEVAIVFANLDPYPRAWNSSYIKFVCLGIFLYWWIFCRFRKCKSTPRAWTSSYV